MKDDSEHIAILKQLGLELLMDEDYKSININDFNPSKVVFYTGGGQQVFDTPTLTYEELEEYIKNQQMCYLTTAKTIFKLRSQDDIRIIQWRKAKKKNHVYYNHILAIHELYQKYKDKISLIARGSLGENYERNRIDEINSIFNNVKRPMKLIINEGGRIRDMKVKIDSAKKIEGLGKADIALMSGEEESFWISYKYGSFFNDNGTVQKYIPFQQYGSVQLLYNNAFALKDEEDVNGEDIIQLFNYFVSKMVNFSGIQVHSLYNVTDIRQYYGKRFYIYHVDGTVTKILKNSELFETFNDSESYKKMVSFIDKNVGNLHFYLQGNSPYYFDFLKSDLLDIKTLKNVAGKSIYGTDFYIGNKKFGRENVNILLQTEKTLEIDVNKNDEIVIKADPKGHIYFNPNQFVEEEFDDLYSPVLYCRFTKKETFKWHDENGRNLIVGGRFMIMPKGKAAMCSIEVK